MVLRMIKVIDNVSNQLNKLKPSIPVFPEGKSSPDRRVGIKNQDFGEQNSCFRYNFLSFKLKKSLKLTNFIQNTLEVKVLLILLLFLCSLKGMYAQTHFFNSFDGTKIAYTDKGEGYPVLLVHGFINSRTSWDKTELKKALLANGYRVIAPDLRGNGASDKPQNDEAYVNDAEVKDLKLLADKLKLKEYYAVGYSRGSIVLAKFLTEENRIKKAVLGGMGIDFTNPDWDRRHMFAAAFNGEITAETKGAVAYAKSIGADLRSLHLQQKYQSVTSKVALSNITAKVLVIAGDKDKDNGDPKDLKEAIPNAQFQLVPGDHNGTYKTAAFGEVILKFLE